MQYSRNRLPNEESASGVDLIELDDLFCHCHIGRVHTGSIMAERTEARRPVNIDKDLLAILCCPDTKQDVSLAEEALIAKLNGAVSDGQLKNRANKLITEPLDGGLIRADRKILYPIREDIPVMLIEEGIPLEGII